MNLTEPEYIFNHFLRANVAEITRTGVANRTSTDTQSYNGDGADKTFVTTNQPLAISSVVVGGVTQEPYIAYQINLDTKTVTFTTAPAVGVSNVVINYIKGSNWIYPDEPRDDLKKLSFPRIVTTKISENSSWEAMGEDQTYNTIIFQIDVLTYKEQMCTIGSEQKEGQDVATKLARNVVAAIRNNWRTQLKGELFHPTITNNFSVPFDVQNNIFRNIIEVQVQAFNIGE